MEQAPNTIRRSLRTTRKRAKPIATSTSKEPPRKRRNKETLEQLVPTSTMDMKENCVRMQGISIGLQRFQATQPSRLSCKENLLASSDSQVSTLYHTRSKRQQPSSAGQQTFLTSNHGQLEVSRDCLMPPPLGLTHSFQPTPDLTSMELYVDEFNDNYHQSNAPLHATTILAPLNGQAYQRPISTSNIFAQKEVPSLHQTSFPPSFGTTLNNLSPLPSLQWAHSGDLWRQMRDKDVTKSASETEVQIRHPGIVPSMRVILLDWILEVCEEYKLHRETYYLAKDMYDRFMDSRNDVQKEQLQLIGVVCLFISSKIEEIYPPKVGEFAYVTDGACSVANILETELIICKTLKWRLNHNLVTVNTWVNTYMQLHSHHLRPPGVNAREFEFPAFSPLEFTRIMQLLDLCTLDMSSRQFGSSVLSATAVYYASERSRPHLSNITGFEVCDLRLCINWMHPFAIVFCQKGAVSQKTFSGVLPQDTHNIQSHDVSISMLDDAKELFRNQEGVPNQFSYLQDSSVVMTPPRGDRRCLAPINTC